MFSTVAIVLREFEHIAVTIDVTKRIYTNFYGKKFRKIREF